MARCVSPLYMCLSSHGLSVKLVMWHWLMFYIGSYGYYTLHCWLLMELCWSALTWTQDWLSSRVPNTPCFHFFPLGLFFSQANVSDKLFITLSVSFWLRREKRLQKWNMVETYHIWKPFLFFFLFSFLFMPIGHMRKFAVKRSKWRGGGDPSLMIVCSQTNLTEVG